MTRRETVLKALAHEEPDRLPYHIECTRAEAEQLSAYYGTRDIDAAVGNYMRLVYPPWWGFVDVPESYKLDPTPGELPPVQGRGSFAAFADNTRRLREQTDCYILSMTYAFNFEKAWMLRGMQRFMVDMMENPGFIHRLLDRIMELNMAYLRLLVSFEGVDGFLLGSD
jgi:uroporphyrinogen decarboxylase